jgi:hypothetical protein
MQAQNAMLAGQATDLDALSEREKKDFFKKLAQSIHTQRQAALAQEQARDAAASELLALRARLARLQRYEDLEPCGEYMIRLKQEGACRSAIY